LRDINLEVEQGEIIGLIGRNGAGKSTLLKIMSRITAPTSGFVKMKGRFASLLEVGTGFHPELTGRENIYLNGSILGMSQAEIDRKFDEIVAFSEVENYIDTPVKRYSSGMRVRLGFAVAAHLDPDILLVDEVLAVGDAAFRKKSLGKMNEVSKQGRTVLFVSHDMPSIQRLVSRCILLECGRIAKIGDPREVIEAYLSAGVTQEGELLFPDDESKVAQITRAAIHNSEEEIVSTLDAHEPIQLDVEFLVRQGGMGKVDVVGLISMVEGPIVMQFVASEAANLPQRWQPGLHRMRAVFPGGLLNSGKYIFRPAVNLSDKAHHNHPNFGLGITFEIAEPKEFGPGNLSVIRRSSLLNTIPEYRLL